MGKYSLMYRLGVTPWERYSHIQREDIGARLDRVTAGRPRPPRRALDLGCGRGMLTPELAARGWEAVGVDLVSTAMEAAREKSPVGVRYEVGDVTRLDAGALGTFDLFFDSGCFQGLPARARESMAASVTGIARPGAHLLLLAFGSNRLQRLVEGVSREDVASAFSGWRLLSANPAPTRGLGWPMNRTNPHWYHFELREPSAAAGIAALDASAGAWRDHEIGGESHVEALRSGERLREQTRQAD